MGSSPTWTSMINRMRAIEDGEVQDLEINGLRTAFVRLIPRGLIGVGEVHTFDTECSVDLDEDGRLIGITVHWQTVTETETEDLPTEE